MKMSMTKSLGCAIVAALGMSAGTAQAASGFSFFIDGDTFSQPFKIDNISDAGETITRFQLDLSPVPLVFNTSSPGGYTAFAPTGGSDATTGLLGTPITVPNFSSLLDLSFSDFQPGEAFTWEIDVDSDTVSDDTIDGDEMIGAVVTVDFSDNVRLIGELQAVPNNDDASQFNVLEQTTVPDAPTPPTSQIPTPAAGMAGLMLLGIMAARRRRQA